MSRIRKFDPPTKTPDSRTENAISCRMSPPYLLEPCIPRINIEDCVKLLTKEFLNGQRLILMDT